jgi:hypothetical protein
MKFTLPNWKDISNPRTTRASLALLFFGFALQLRPESVAHQFRVRDWLLAIVMVYTCVDLGIYAFRAVFIRRHSLRTGVDSALLLGTTLVQFVTAFALCYSILAQDCGRWRAVHQSFVTFLNAPDTAICPLATPLPIMVGDLERLLGLMYLSLFVVVLAKLVFERQMPPKEPPQ